MQKLEVKQSLLTEEEYAARKEKLYSDYDISKEFIVNGELVCKTCGDPVIFDDPKHMFVTRCLCSCRLNAWKAEEMRRERAARRARGGNETFENLNALGSAYRNAWFNTLDLKHADESYVEAAARCEKFCSAIDEVKRTGRGIWLYGAGGVGKTHFAACMVHALRRAGRTCLYTNVGKIVDAVMATYKSKASLSAADIKAYLAGVDVLIVDRPEQVFSEKDAEKRTRIFAEIAEARAGDLLPTVILSRLTIPDYAKGNVESAELMGTVARTLVPIKLTGRDRFGFLPAEATEF